MKKFRCRYCGAELETCMLDLGFSPLSNDYLAESDIEKGQYTLPLRTYYCDCCKLVQIVNYEAPEGVFNQDYKYFSSFSKSWLRHCEDYVDDIVVRLNLSKGSKVMEVASNDGYLLQYFLRYGISPLGIEPSTATADVAREKGIETLDRFFGQEFAKELVEQRGKFDLIIGNNVLAHIPFIDDFVKGLKESLNENGTITMEFPHLLNLMQYRQFDTIYHEHFSYLSMLAVGRIFNDNRLKIYDIQKLDTHGGSLRIFATHTTNESIAIQDSVHEIEREEIKYGLDKAIIYSQFGQGVKELKWKIWKKLAAIKQEGKSIIGYGAAAKGNTLFNYCGIKKDVVDYVTDLSSHKQGLYLPGSLIPIVQPDKIRETKPDYIIIVPWNLKEEIMEQLQYVREWGCRFLTLVPDVVEH